MISPIQVLTGLALLNFIEKTRALCFHPEDPFADWADAHMVRSIHCLHMSGWPFFPTSIYITTASATTTIITTTITATTTAYSNDKCPNMRNGSFHN